jgi:NADH-quinone oxidoreductase subunit N
MMIILAISSIFIGVTGGLFQRKLKRLMAFSAISHGGFILLATSCYSIESIKAMSFYLVIYIITSLVLFYLIAIPVTSGTGLLKYLINWLDFGKRNYLAAVCFSIVLFSIAGIPPLAGFYSKLLIFTALLRNSNILASIIIALLSCASCFYYIRLIKIFFFESYSKATWINSTSRNIEVVIAFGLFAISFLLIHFEVLFLTILGFSLSLFSV